MNAQELSDIKSCLEQIKLTEDDRVKLVEMKLTGEDTYTKRFCLMRSYIECIMSDNDIDYNIDSKLDAPKTKILYTTTFSLSDCPKLIKILTNLYERPNP